MRVREAARVWLTCAVLLFAGACSSGSGSPIGIGVVGGRDGAVDAAGGAGGIGVGVGTGRGGSAVGDALDAPGPTASPLDL